MQAAAEPMRKPPKMDESDVGLVTGDIKKLESEANRLGQLINDSFKAYFKPSSLAIGGNKRKFPDFIVIGMQKCGTTALQYFLNYHPQLKSPSEGELHFFEREGNYQKGYEYYLNQMPFAAEGID